MQPTKSLHVQLKNPTGTGLTMRLVLNLDAYWDLLSSESFQSRISTLDAGSHMLISLSSFPEDLVEVSDTRSQSSSTTRDSRRELCWTTQISTGGTCAEFCQETHQFQMPTESGWQDNNQCIINTTRSSTDTEWEDQDTSIGTDHRASQSCHTSSIRVRMSSTEPSRRTATPLQRSSEEDRYGKKSYSSIKVQTSSMLISSRI